MARLPVRTTLCSSAKLPAGARAWAGASLNDAPTCQGLSWYSCFLPSSALVSLERAYTNGGTLAALAVMLEPIACGHGQATNDARMVWCVVHIFAKVGFSRMRFRRSSSPYL